jgi:hypothetical protein
MNFLKINGQKRIIARIMAVLMLSFVLAASFFIIAEAAHECEGEDCPICVSIKTCFETLVKIGGGVVLLFSVRVLFAVISELTNIYGISLSGGTLVTKKVRLNI